VAGSNGLRWVVDPLDGTINFLFGIPFWCVSVAVQDEAGTLAGVVHDPLREETFTAECAASRCYTMRAAGSPRDRARRRLRRRWSGPALPTTPPCEALRPMR